jgi:hypothetical protein
VTRAGSRIYVWADGTWCSEEDIHEYGWMPDDYEVIELGPYVNPARLPVDHPLRLAPLRDIGAQLRNVRSTLWREAGLLQIGQLAYNDLAPDVWHAFNEWRIPLD